MTDTQINQLIATIGKPVLRLTLHRKWFDMIATGEKTEEYREIKPYWARLFPRGQYGSDEHGPFYNQITLKGKGYRPEYVLILFSNGYGPTARKMLVELKSVRRAYGRKEWGGNTSDQPPLFVFKLGTVAPLNFEI